MAIKPFIDNLEGEAGHFTAARGLTRVSAPCPFNEFREEYQWNPSVNFF
jgi:hypothetical protein